MQLHPNTPIIIDLFGIFFFALTGSIVAAEKKLDAIGSLTLASMTGLGGGIIRDVIIGGAPPRAFTEIWYFAPPIVATIIIYYAFKHVPLINTTLIICDAIGLSLFCITGTIKALDNNFNFLASVLLGVITAVGGGIIRDVLVNKIPDVFKPNELYAIPSLIGACTIAIIWFSNHIHPASATAVFAVTFILRIVAWKYKWKTPMSYKKHI